MSWFCIQMPKNSIGQIIVRLYTRLMISTCYTTGTSLRSNDMMKEAWLTSSDAVLQTMNKISLFAGFLITRVHFPLLHAWVTAWNLAVLNPTRSLCLITVSAHPQVHRNYSVCHPDCQPFPVSTCLGCHCLGERNIGMPVVISSHSEYQK